MQCCETMHKLIRVLGYGLGGHGIYGSCVSVFSTWSIIMAIQLLLGGCVSHASFIFWLTTRLVYIYIDYIQCILYE